MVDEVAQEVGERLNLVVFLLLIDDFLARVLTVRLDSQHGSVLHPTNLEFHGHVLPFSDGEAYSPQRIRLRWRRRNTYAHQGHACETFGLLVVDRQMNQITACGGGLWGVRFCA